MTSPCQRARQYSSLEVDGELSQLERALLLRHLDGCRSCREFDGRLRATTLALRSASAEKPSARFRPPAPFLSFPARRRVALAAVAAAAVLGSVVGALLDGPSRPAPSPRPTEVSFLTSDEKQLRELPRQDRSVPATPSREPGLPPEGTV